MTKYFIVIITICTVSFSTGYYVANRKTETYKETITTASNKKLTELTNTYQKSLESYKEQLSSLQKNNITTLKTIYLPSGEKVITRTVDRTILSTQTNKRATEENLTGEVNNKTWEVQTSSSMVKEKSSSLANYKIGITGLQYTDFKDFSDLKITSGIRLFSLPLFFTAQAPTTSSFYKKIELGLEIEL